MTPVGAVLAARIAREGAISFRDFMEAALYHPEHGYYRRPRDPFGAAGDFFTAEQVQPVFGILVAQRVRQLARAMGDAREFTVVEPGAGRREMAEAFAEWRYYPVDIDGGEMPERFRGVVFSNEFFDALPVRAVEYTGGAFRELLVTFEGESFHWTAGGAVDPAAERYLTRFFPPPEEGRRYEVPDLEPWVKRIAGGLSEGWVLTIDYGFTREESIRFPRGTLMGYRRHTALEDVLAAPGERDITAHVNFRALGGMLEERGFVTERFETLASMLLRAGEEDQFAAALGEGSDAARRRGQLKQLLFGMGETFRVHLARRDSNRTAVPEK
ncbi:MAG: SAM-dependent methyltransferase [Acidobacteriota bacterium]|nr:SAM-dependent methyltransferase [Acidobacteriota bacterium]